jgi:hypothetical protein
VTHNAGMKRVLLLLPVVLVLAVVILAATRQDSGRGPSAADGGLSAQELPYPRTTKPLPVPEVHVGERPWAEQPPGVEPAVPVPRQGSVTAVPRCEDAAHLWFCRTD